MACSSALRTASIRGAHYLSVPVRPVVFVLLAVSGTGIVVMMAVTCLDVVLRWFGHPIPGAVDIVRLTGAVTVACALPYTTAVKGHVAVEFFFHKLNPLGRIVVDTLVRLLGVVLFGVLSWRSALYGESLRRSGTGTPTLQLPMFWVAYVIAFACAVVALVIVHNLLHPGKEMIKP